MSRCLDCELYLARIREMEGWSGYKNRVRAEAAERKVDEYRQRIDRVLRVSTLSGWTADDWRKQFELLARDALRVEQPRQERAANLEPEKWPYEMCNCAHCVSWRTAYLEAAEPEREGAER